MDSLGSRSHATVGRHESSNAARSQTVGAVICRYQCLCIDTIESLCSAEALALAKSLGEHGLCRLALSCKPWHRTDRCIATIAVTLQLSSSACHKTQAIYGTAEMRRLRCMMQPRSIADAVWWIARCLAMLLQTWDFAVAPDPPRYHGDRPGAVPHVCISCRACASSSRGRGTPARYRHARQHRHSCIAVTGRKHLRERTARPVACTQD